jgi:hypothetical protein
MNTPQNGSLPDPVRRDAYGAGEDTLRLIASLPAPLGLADRVHAGLQAAPQATRIFMVRGPLRPPGGWMESSILRGFAAAAIVCVVAGGGWRIYSHVQPALKVVVIPAPVSQGVNGFSNAGAKRVPDTLNGPVVPHSVAAGSEVDVVEKVPAQPRPAPPASTAKKKALRSPVAPVQ